MAIIPNGEKVLMTSANVNTTYGGSAALKELNKWYTIEDIAETIGGGGGGFGDFIIESNGTMGTGPNVSYSFAVDTTGIHSGLNVFPIRNLASISFYSGGGYGVSFTATEVDFPGLEYGSSLTFNGTPLVVIGFSDLIGVLGSMAYFSMNQNQLLTTVSAPSLTSAGNMNMSSNPLLVNLDFASLKDVAYNFNIENTPIAALTSVELPVLETVANIQTSNVSNISLPTVKKIEGVTVNGSSLTNLNLPGVERYKGNSIGINSFPSLTNVVLGTIGTLKKVTTSDAPIVYNFQVNFSSCSLNQSSVDGILTLFASLDGTNDTCRIENGSMYLLGGSNASPSGTGAAAVQELLSRGWYVATN